MLHIYQGGSAAHSSVVLSPADFRTRERPETKWFPELTVKITVGGRQFTILERGKRRRQ